MPGPPSARASTSPFPVELQRKLESEGTLLLHGCGLVRGGMGYLFLADSGGGKSTLARMSAGEADCLSDEHLMLWTQPAERIASPPCCPNAACPEGAPLSAAFLLRKAPALAFDRVSPAAFLSALTAQLYASTWEAGHARRLLASARAVCERTPCFEMGFSMESRPWNRIPDLTTA